MITIEDGVDELSSFDMPLPDADSPDVLARILHVSNRETTGEDLNADGAVDAADLHH
ncbi:hypothetical protein BH09SUM1_BH09SUM1_22860 [soil metagenome]